MSTADILIVLAASMMGGAVSAVAGGGGLFTFPTLLEIGVPPVIANATNNVGLFPANAFGSWAYRRELARWEAPWLSYAIVSAVGGLAGGLLLLATGEAAFTAAIPWLLLTATLLLAFGNRAVQWLAGSGIGERAQARTRHHVGLVVLFAASVYGGYFGTALGIMLLGMMVVAGIGDFQRMNALKNLLSVLISALAVAVFIVTGLVDWPVAITMCIGSAIGGYTGASVARRLSPDHVRWFVIAVGLLLSVRYFVKQFT